MNETLIYLIGHAITTITALLIFLLRNEHRLTALETRLQILQGQHDIYTRAAGRYLDMHGPDNRGDQINNQ